MKNVSCPTLSSPFELVLVKVRSSSSAMFRIFSTNASLHVVQQAMGTAILLGNLQSSKVTELYADTQLLDGTAFFEWIDMDHVERHCRIIQGYESQEANNMPEAKPSAPKTCIERIGTLNSVDGVVSLNVNHSNVASGCVDVKNMEATRSPNLILSLNKFFIGLICSADFQS